MALLADIESGSVAVAVALFESGKPARVLLSERTYLPLEGRDDVQAVTRIPTLLAETIGNIVKTYDSSDIRAQAGRIKAVHAFLSHPWSMTRTIHAEALIENHAVTEKELHALAEEALRQHPAEERRETYESSISRVHLNGYPTAKPVGKHASSVAVTVLESSTVPTLRQTLEDTLRKAFPLEPDFRSSVRAALTTLHEISSEDHATIIQMGSDATVAIAARRDELVEHVVIPEGMASILKKISGTHGLPDEMLSLLRMTVADATSGAAGKELRDGLARLEPGLVKIFADALGSLAAERRLPNTCALIAHTDIAPWLEHFFTRIDFSPLTATAQPFDVVSLTPGHVRSFVTFEQGTREDTGIALASSFIHITRSHS